MDLVSIAIVATALLCFSLISGRLDGTIITAPLVFILFGWLIGSADVANLDPGHSAIHIIAELTLILVLFSDAARIDLGQVRSNHNLPVRMLVIGLPITMIFGAGIALLLFPDFLFWEAVLLAAMLAPTDAALGLAVVTAKQVPMRIRQAINIESGLNDGMALPVVLMVATLVSMESGGANISDWVRFGVLQITLGPIVGVILGYTGARLLDLALERGLANEAYQGIGILSLTLLIYVAAELIGGNGFIAAFVGGMVFGNSIRHTCTFLFEFMETEGQLLMLITFLVFGAVLLPEGLAHLNMRVVVYAVLSLTVIRMLPIGLSLIGSGIRLPSILFLGWFGPRGLASILFVLLILEQSAVPHREELLTATVITVALSALAHGITAAPLARRYGQFTARMGECEENKTTSHMPLRKGHGEV